MATLLQVKTELEALRSGFNNDPIKVIDRSLPPPRIGCNPKFFVSSSNSAWVVKFSENPGLVTDICEREQAVSVLGKLLGVPVVSAIVIGCPTLISNRLDGYSSPQLIRNNCVLMPRVIGHTVAEAPDLSSIPDHSDQIAELLLFSFWIGDEDRGLHDVMIEGDRLCYIDNGLCGPGNTTDPRRRAVHPYGNRFSDEELDWMCELSKPPFFKYAIQSLNLSKRDLATPPLFDRIAALSDDTINDAVAYCGVSNPMHFAIELINRKNSLKSDYGALITRIMCYHSVVPY